MKLTRGPFNISARLAFPRFGGPKMEGIKWVGVRRDTIPPELESWRYGYACTPDIPDEHRETT